MLAARRVFGGGRPRGRCAALSWGCRHQRAAAAAAAAAAAGAAAAAAHSSPAACEESEAQEVVREAALGSESRWRRVIERVSPAIVS